MKGEAVSRQVESLYKERGKRVRYTPGWLRTFLGALQDQDRGGSRRAAGRRSVTWDLCPSLPETKGEERQQICWGCSCGIGGMLNESNLRMALSGLPTWTPLGKVTLHIPQQLQGRASDHQEHIRVQRIHTWPQNKAATEVSSVVIEFRILLKLEGEAD